MYNVIIYRHISDSPNTDFDSCWQTAVSGPFEGRRAAEQFIQQAAASATFRRGIVKQIEE